MRLKSSNGIHSDIPLLILASLVLLELPSRNAVADDLLGLYIGGAVGQSELRANINSFDCGPTLTNCSSGIPSVSFVRHTTGWEAFAGIRSLPFLGAETEYIDFGSSGTTNVLTANFSGIAGSGTTIRLLLRFLLLAACRFHCGTWTYTERPGCTRRPLP